LPSTPTPRLPYAAALDGLRALAVAAVLGYHLDISWMRGGFLGVDLFFVISGFLITRLLLGEYAASGRIALGAFWIRRFRRLVPPLVVVVAASIAATRLWGVPAQWDAMRSDAIASLAYVANWHFILNDTSYFETLLGPSPLRHVWSLAVEEQWYLIWPLIMVALAPLAARRHGFGLATLLLLVAAAASALWMAVLYDPNDLSRVYYGTDTRAQQLLVGAALAWFTVAAPGRFSSESLARFRVPVSLLLMGFVGAVLLVDDEAPWLYRGGLLALSVGAAVLVAAASVPGGRGPLGWLTWRPLVALGQRSYSLYLWHWPVIVFVGPPMGLELAPVPLAILRIVVSLGLTELTYRWVETPVRSSSARPIRVIGAWSTAALLTVAGASVALMTDLAALPDIDVLRPAVVPLPDTLSMSTVPRPTATGPTPADTTLTDTTLMDSDAEAVSVDRTTESPGQDIPASPIRGEAVASARTEQQVPRLLLVGDSTAFVLAEGRQDRQPGGWLTIEYARLGCAITDGKTIDVGDKEPVKFGEENLEACRQWEADWTELSAQFQPSVSVIMVGAWEVLDHVVDGQRLSFPSLEWTSHVENALRRGVDAASAGGGQVALLTLPCMEQAPGSLVNAQARNDPLRVDAFNAILDDIATEQPSVSTLPLDEVLCPAGQPVGEIGGNQIRYDGVHLTEFGTQLVWDWLETQLNALQSRVN